MILFSVIWNVPPEFFVVTDSYAVRWYGVLFALGYLLSYYILQRIFVKENLPLPLLEKATLASIIGGVLGARLGHCIFYEPLRYLQDPLSILYVWEGGLASHGGAIGIVLAFLIVVRKSEISYATIMARAMLVVPLAGFFIRMGNLMNSEIYGVQTNAPWGFVFSYVGETVPKHPTQIYEALAYLLTFIVLQYYAWKQLRTLKKLSNHFIIGIFLIGIFFTRFLIEFIKEPQVLFETTMLLNMGQLLSIPFFVYGFWVLWKELRVNKITLP